MLPNQSISTTNSLFLSIEILGFDRLGFVKEVTETGSEMAHICKMKFEVHGAQASGKIIYQLKEHSFTERFLQQLKNIKGMVKVTQQPIIL